MTDRKLKVIVGLGKTGFSCVRYLTQKGNTVAVVDSREEPPGLKDLREQFPQIRVSLGKFDETLLAKAEELILSPGVSMREPAIAKQIAKGVPVKGDIELFAQAAKAPIVAITGSNGKSTVTSLVGYLAESSGVKVKVGGNLGTPALDLLKSDTELYVLELSSFQLETTYTLATKAAVNLNISPDHLDRYRNIEEYIAAKLRIYKECQKPIINLDDPRSYQTFPFQVPTLGFTLKEPRANELGLRSHHDQTFLACGEKLLLATNKLTLKGQHQFANVLAALALGSAVGLPMEKMLQSIINFKGLPHRCQWVANINGVDWYNDSKATNVGSAQAAILGLGPETQGKLVILAGGQGKNADFKELYEPVKKYARTIILYGQDQAILAKDLRGAAPIVLASNFEKAIACAHEVACQGDIVILAPACASFDMFTNFEHRGERFMELVKGLQK